MGEVDLPTAEAQLRPTPRQIYFLARLLCEENDLPYPATRGEATELIKKKLAEKDGG